MKIEPSRREFVQAAAAATATTLTVRGGAIAQTRADGPGDWAHRNATELLAALANKRISSVDLVDFSIARIEALDKRLNAVVVRDFDRARAAAKAADAALARGERRPLLGLPMTVKESFGVVGLPTTWGNSAFKDWQPSVDALAVARLKAAGAIILGKTNVPISLADWQSYNEVYGITNNPWDLGRTPGGSSGGSAAALAAGLVPLELGSDIGGSLRAPAHYCGVFSHKPTLDLVPLRGAGPPGTPPASGRVDLAVAGPMARSAADLALELDAEVDGRQVPYFDQVVWAGPATLLGLPATTMPIERTDAGLPIGVQIIGGYLEDRTTIAFAGLIEREFGRFVPPPMP
jgi:amidase